MFFSPQFLLQNVIKKSFYSNAPGVCRTYGSRRVISIFTELLFASLIPYFVAPVLTAH